MNNGLLLLPKGEAEEIQNQHVFICDTAGVDRDAAHQIGLLLTVADAKDLDAAVRQGAVLFQRVPPVQEPGLPPAPLALGIVPQAKVSDCVIGKFHTVASLP